MICSCTSTEINLFFRYIFTLDLLHLFLDRSFALRHHTRPHPYFFFIVTCLRTATSLPSFHLIYTILHLPLPPEPYLNFWVPLTTNQFPSVSPFIALPRFMSSFPFFPNSSIYLRSLSPIFLLKLSMRRLYGPSLLFYPPHSS